MALSKKPTTGMKDILPREMEIRDYVTDIIKETYKSYGFTHIETPCVENINNLNCKAGGENEKLIFKILKRGEKLHLDHIEGENDLVDSGLRYDLTVPLVRFFSANRDQLPAPFKAFQMGPVWRADRPQRGRFRQFYQCDIDILGDSSNLAEIELITATTSVLGKLGFKNFEIRINERRILKAMAAYAGFAPESFEDVFISLDKMDKIGIDGVREDLLKQNMEAKAVDKYLSLFGEPEGEASFGKICDAIKEFLEPEVKDNLETIIKSVEIAKEADFKVIFDPTLVRGMSYYTGTIFEIAIPEFGGSCGGGGRYDEMVGKFTGQNTPACGFSIGFERIVMLLKENDFKIPGDSEKVAFLIEKGIESERLAEIMAEASELRRKGTNVLVTRMNKNRKFQKESLREQGYECRDFYLESLKN